MAKEAMELTSTGNGATNGLSANLDATKPNVADLVKTPHNTRLFQANQVLKKQLDELIEYEIAHPRNPRPVTPEEINSDKQISGEITARERRIRTQLSLVKSLYRKSVLKVREEKAETADDRAVNDALILGLHNLKYEEQSLRSEIAAAENYDHKYTKLQLIPAEEFLERFPQHADASEHDLMLLRIENEHQERKTQNNLLLAKLKQKQTLINEVKNSKDDLTKLDSMVEKFVEAAQPIREVLKLAAEE